LAFNIFWGNSDAVDVAVAIAVAVGDILVLS
jgi:hypothetical protein